MRMKLFLVSFSSFTPSLTPYQVPMGLHHCVEVLSRLRFRYLLRHYHVNHQKLVK